MKDLEADVESKQEICKPVIATKDHLIYQVTKPLMKNLTKDRLYTYPSYPSQSAYSGISTKIINVMISNY